MRVGASILFLDGYCYQSYGWKKSRPLGRLQNVIDSLEEYQCDEIVITRPIRDNESLDIFKKDIKIIENINCMTPISFGGGLRDIMHINMLHKLPIERLLFSSTFINGEHEIIEYAIKVYGHQAIQCVLPFRFKGNDLEIFSSSKNKFILSNKIDFTAIDILSNEIVLIDTFNEGSMDNFNKNILDKFGLRYDKLVISGGIGKGSIRYASRHNLAAAIIENKVLHREYSIRGYKNV